MTERDADSRAVRETLQKPDVHEKWARDFRTPGNARFYDAAFRFIASELDVATRPRLLDAGCGSCDYWIRMAEHGFRVTAVDFSETVLEEARRNLADHGVEDRVTAGSQDLLGLSFPDDHFDAVLCWGVLMHIPDVERAAVELGRVLRPGGRLAVSETNMRSVEAAGLRFLRRAMGPENARVTRTPAGVESWGSSEAGEFMTRECDIDWLVNRFGESGIVLRKRVAGQFSESFVRVSSASAQRLIHGWNQLWFDRVRLAGPSLGNILIFEKPLRDS